LEDRNTNAHTLLERAAEEAVVEAEPDTAAGRGVGGPRDRRLGLLRRCRLRPERRAKKKGDREKGSSSHGGRCTRRRRADQGSDRLSIAARTVGGCLHRSVDTPLQPNQLSLQRRCNRCGAVSHTELVERVEKVGLDGGLADSKHLCDLAVRRPLGDALEDVELSSAERV